MRGWSRWFAVVLAAVSVIGLAVWLVPPARDAAGLYVTRLFPTHRPVVVGTSAVTLHGITLRIERTQRTPDGLRVHVSATDHRGGRVDIIRAHGLAGRDYLSETGGAAGWDLHLPSGLTALTIDDVSVMEPGVASLELDIPASGSIVINRLIILGSYPLLLKTGAWVDDPGNGHVFRIAFHTEAVDGRQLDAWRIDGVGSLVIQGTGTPGDGWIELAPNQPHSPPPGHASLTFWQPMSSVNGPWVLPIR